jgi:predicted DNA binding CopG/RHH family protein
MKKHYDFSKSKPSPYIKKPKRQVTTRLGEGPIVYFKGMAARAGIPYQNLINLYSRNCVAERKQLKMEWAV